LAVKINGNRGAQQEIFVSTKVSKEIVPFQSTGIPNLRVWRKKWSNWTSGAGIGQKNPTPTPSVFRNPTQISPQICDSGSDSATLVSTNISYKT